MIYEWLAGAGKAILMAEQNVRKALDVSDRAPALIGDERVARLYLGMGGAA